MNGRVSEPAKVQIDGVDVFLWWDNQALIDTGRQMGVKGPQGFYKKLQETFSKYVGGETEVYFDDIEIIGSLIYNSVRAGSRYHKKEVPVDYNKCLDNVNDATVWGSVFSVIFGTAPSSEEITDQDAQKKSPPTTKPGT